MPINAAAFRHMECVSNAPTLITMHNPEPIHFNKHFNIITVAALSLTLVFKYRATLAIFDGFAVILHVDRWMVGGVSLDEEMRKGSATLLYGRITAKAKTRARANNNEHESVLQQHYTDEIFTTKRTHGKHTDKHTRFMGMRAMAGRQRYSRMCVSF